MEELDLQDVNMKYKTYNNWSYHRVLAHNKYYAEYLEEANKKTDKVMKKWDKNNPQPTSSKERCRYFIIKPLCHGNGGWYGSSVEHSFRTLKEALSFMPRWDQEYSPYGGRCINNPRLCRTKDINKPIYIYDLDDYCWNKVNE